MQYALSLHFSCASYFQAFAQNLNLRMVKTGGTQGFLWSHLAPAGPPRSHGQVGLQISKETPQSV